ncbi:MAG: hypothetical protein L6Q54_05380 [Leptospiraceae bacterium]|nr:hypothetical protein [Leptospiraceae bacterium]MCK6380670.1 hypothetical protein [Leptospiraceae bacterium]NUM41546.1 hypothetical protein [Leptospiraceae bacterium]
MTKRKVAEYLVLSIFFFLNSIIYSEKVLYQKEVQIAPRKIITNEVSEEKKIEEKKKISQKKIMRQMEARIHDPKKVGKIYKDEKGRLFSNSYTQFNLETNFKKYKESITYYSINGIENKKYTEPIAIQEEGEKRIAYFSEDNLGNKEETKDFFVIIDNTPPKISVFAIDPPTNHNGILYIKPGQKFKISAIDSISGLKNIYVDEGEGFQIVQGEEYELKSEGSFSLSFISEDNLENKSEKVVFQVVSDSKNPKLVYNIQPLVEKEGYPFCTPKSIVTLEGKDNESGLKKIQYRKNGEEKWTVYQKPISIIEKEEFKLEAMSIDLAGNSSDILSIECKIDNTPPETEIIIQKSENEK